MAITRYEPWTVVSQLQNEINRVFGNLHDPESSSATAEWIPAVDVREYTDRFELLADVPGVDPFVGLSHRLGDVHARTPNLRSSRARCTRSRFC